MTMMLPLDSRPLRTTGRGLRVIVWGMLLAATFLGLTESSQAQTGGMHYLHSGSPPLGSVGQWRIRSGGPVKGYYQPVEVQAPAGTQVAFAAEGRFGEPLPAPVVAGLLIAPVYRLRVTNIPNFEGVELFPTIEVIDRLYPPAGQATKFPIPVELTLDDMRLAMEGKFVTRVIYLEDPDSALPTLGSADHPDWFDAGPGANPLKEADRLGRPMAILRMGGRLPLDLEDAEDTFLRQCAPLIIHHQPTRRPISEPAPTSSRKPTSPVVIPEGLPAPDNSPVEPNS